MQEREQASTSSEAPERDEGEQSTIELSDHAASPVEVEWGERTISFLQSVQGGLSDDRCLAQLLLDVATAQASPLGNAEAAFGTMREAFRLSPDAVHVARAYRKAAIRAGAWSDVVAAAEAEAKSASADTYRAALDAERGRLLWTELDNPRAARAAYLVALEANPSDILSLMALERLALAEEDRKGAAEWASRLAKAVNHPALRAEHTARAARHLERWGDPAHALSLASEGKVHNPASLAVEFALERLYAAEGSVSELIGLRRWQIEQGLVPAASGWLDVAVLARYRLGNRHLAIEAFTELSNSAEGDLKLSAMAELSGLLETTRRWDQLMDVDKQRIALLADPTARAELWTRIGSICVEHLVDEDQALVAYEQALGQAPAFPPALEGAGRLYQVRGSRDQLIEMHWRAAEASTAPEAKGSALCRVGALLAEDPEKLDEAIAALEEGVEAGGNNHLAFSALEKAYTAKRAWAELADLYQREIDSLEEGGRRAWLLSRLGSVCADHLLDRSRAIAAFRRSADSNMPHPPESLVRLAQLLEAEADYDGLADVLSRLSDNVFTPTELASLLERLGMAHERRGAKEEALETYRRALAIAPPTHSVNRAAGGAFIRADKYEDLAALLEKASRNGDDRARAMWLQKLAGVLSRYLGRTDEAIERLRESLDLVPGFELSVRSLASLFEAEERWEDLQAVLEGDTSDAMVLLKRGALSEATGDTESAVVLYGMAVAAGLGAAKLCYLRLLPEMEGWASLVGDYGGGDTPRDWYRAGEIALEKLDSPQVAAQHLSRAIEVSPTDLSVLLALVTATEAEPRERSEILERFRHVTEDPATMVALESMLATTLEGLGDSEPAFELRCRSAERNRKDPVVSVAVEIGLEQRNQRSGLVEHYRRCLDGSGFEEGLRSSTQVALARVQGELGCLQEAADAFQESIRTEAVHASIFSRVELARLRRVLDDEDAYIEAMRVLAEALPAGPARAQCHLAVAYTILMEGQIDQAILALQEALRADPVDYEALRLLDRLLTSRDDRGRLVDPLRRAFEAEDRTEVLVPLGNTLAVQLIRLDRVDAAREVMERVTALAPGDLRTLMVYGHVLECLDQSSNAAMTFLEIASHEDADGWTVVEALRRATTLQVQKLSDLEGARGTAGRLAEVVSDSVSDLESLAELQELVEDYAACAETLRKLLESEGLASDARVGHLLRLASLQEDKLGDEAAAIATLGSVAAPAHREEAVSHLLRLGEQTGRWDLASVALESALEGAEGMERDWELAIRTRLARLLEGPLERPDAAARQYERIVELEPVNVAAIERLADLVGGEDKQKALEYERMLVQAQPDQLDLYRRLRARFLQEEDVDGAFCAEAVLEGLGAAEEEETYFYRQRRAFLGKGFEGGLSREDLLQLSPESAEPAIRMLAALGPVMAHVFPVDWAAYGIDADQESSPGALAEVVAEMATLFGISDYRVHLVGARMGPAVEPGAIPLLLLPRDLADAVHREQRFVLGALFGRIALGMSLTDPRRVNAVSAKHLQYAMDAALTLLVPEHEVLSSGPIYEDIRKRIDTNMTPDIRELATPFAREIVETEGVGDMGRLLHIAARSAARAGLLAAQDPAVAVLAMKAYSTMFSMQDESEAELPSAAMEAIPFAVSKAHSEMRRRMQMDIPL